MKTYIVGSGGIGGYVGALLATSGKDVTFVARGEHFDAIKNKGLKVKSVPGDFEVKEAKVVSRFADIKDPELIIFAVKTYDTDEIAQELSSVLDKGSVLVSFQNGVDNDERIKNHIRNGEVYPGVAYISSTKSGPGMIEQTGGPRKFIFGDRTNPQNPKVKNVADWMREAGVDAMASSDITGELWKKYMFILTFSGMTAICRSPIGRVLGDSTTEALFKRCLIETIEVAKAMAVPVEEKAFETIMMISRNFPPDTKSSLLVDIEKRGRTEIETLTGNLVRLARKKGIDVPLNELIYGALKAIEP